MKKVWDYSIGIILGIILIFGCLLFLPRFFGIQPMAVLSGSMEPTYHVGSLLFIKEAKAEDIQVEDPITFYLAGGDTVVTHRVMEVNAKEKTFLTKGDANADLDSGAVSFQDLIGKPILHLPMLGYVAMFVDSTQGKIVSISVIVILILLMFLSDLIFKDKKTKNT